MIFYFEIIDSINIQFGYSMIGCNFVILIYF